MKVLDELERAPWAFDFHMALRHLDRAYPDRPRLGTARAPAEEPIRLGQDPSLAFAPAALRAFTAPKDGVPGQLRVAFLGLFGPGGPLPLHFTERARDSLRAGADGALAAFVDLFHHRLLAFFQRAWADSQPVVAQDRREHNAFLRHVGSLCGLGLPSMFAGGAVPHAAKVQFVARLSGGTRNAEGLEAIIADYFGVRVQIEEFVGEWLEIPREQRWQLGRARDVSTLGENTVAGARSFQRGHKFRVTIGPLGAGQYQSFLPGTARLATLAGLVRAYLGDELEWDLRLLHEPEERPALRLGRSSRLGYNAWLGRDRSAGVGIEELVVEPPRARGSAPRAA